MIFRFTLISDEVEDFIREYKIDADATFYDLHQIILKRMPCPPCSCGRSQPC